MKTPDVFNNDKRYIVTNWSSEDFVCTWAGQATSIKAGESREFPEYLAFHLTKHFVDHEMTKEGKERMTSVEEARKEYEDKTMGEISEGMDSPVLAALKERIRKEIEEDKIDEDGDPRTENKKAKKVTKKEEVKEIVKEEVKEEVVEEFEAII